MSIQPDLLIPANDLLFSANRLRSANTQKRQNFKTQISKKPNSKNQIRNSKLRVHRFQLRKRPLELTKKMEPEVQKIYFGSCTFWILVFAASPRYDLFERTTGLLGETMHTAGLYYRNNGCFQKITSRLNNRAVDFQTRFDLQKATYLICNSSERKNRYKSATH